MGHEDESTGFRLVRLQELMREELSGLLSDDVSDPNLFAVRITALVLSVDYRHARIHFGLRATDDEARARRAAVERSLVRATPFFRARLADALDLKRVPDLRFVFDGAIVVSEEPR